jgi:hypothetical protein
VIEPVDIFHVPDHSYVKGPRGARGCKAIRSDGVTCGAAHFNPMHNLPTMNETLTHDWAVYQGALKHWKLWLNDALVEARLPKGMARVVVMMECVFPDRNRRDRGNMRGFIEKALGDTLVDGGWIADDKFFPVDHYDFADVEARYEKGVRKTRLTFMPEMATHDPSSVEEPFPTLW